MTWALRDQCKSIKYQSINFEDSILCNQDIVNSFMRNRSVNNYFINNYDISLSYKISRILGSGIIKELAWDKAKGEFIKTEIVKLSEKRLATERFIHLDSAEMSPYQPVIDRFLSEGPGRYTVFKISQEHSLGRVTLISDSSGLLAAGQVSELQKLYSVRCSQKGQTHHLKDCFSFKEAEAEMKRLRSTTSKKPELVILYKYPEDIIR